MSRQTLSSDDRRQVRFFESNNWLSADQQTYTSARSRGRQVSADGNRDAYGHDIYSRDVYATADSTYDRSQVRSPIFFEADPWADRNTKCSYRDDEQTLSPLRRVQSPQLPANYVPDYKFSAFPSEYTTPKNYASDYTTVNQLAREYKSPVRRPIYEDDLSSQRKIERFPASNSVPLPTRVKSPTFSAPYSAQEQASNVRLSGITSSAQVIQVQPLESGVCFRKCGLCQVDRDKDQEYTIDEWVCNHCVAASRGECLKASRGMPKTVTATATATAATTTTATAPTRPSSYPVAPAPILSTKTQVVIPAAPITVVKYPDDSKPPSPTPVPTTSQAEVRRLVTPAPKLSAAPAASVVKLGTHSSAFEAVVGSNQQYAQAIQNAKDKITSQPALQPHGMAPQDLRDVLRLVSSATIRQPGIAELQRLGQKLGCTVDIAPPKEYADAKVKVTLWYGGDVLQLTDINSATVQCPDTETLVRAVQWAVDEWTSVVKEVVGLEDFYFASPPPDGYRHVQMVVRFNGVLWEAHFSTASFLEARRKIGESTQHVNEVVLYYSIHNDMASLGQLFAQPGAKGMINVNLPRDKYGMTALHHAAFQGNLPLIALLLQHGADILVVDDLGQLPILHAVIGMQWKAAEAIAEKMMSVAIPDNEDMFHSILVALEYLLDNCRPKLAEALLEILRRMKRVLSGDFLLRLSALCPLGTRQLLSSLPPKGVPQSGSEVTHVMVRSAESATRGNTIVTTERLMESNGTALSQGASSSNIRVDSTGAVYNTVAAPIYTPPNDAANEKEWVYTSS